MLEEVNRSITLAINLETPEEEIIERSVNRRVCSNQECKAVYNVLLNPPKQEGICDKCGSELITRKDDKLETVKNRLEQLEQDLTSDIKAIEKYTKLQEEFIDKGGYEYETKISKILAAFEITDEMLSEDNLPIGKNRRETIKIVNNNEVLIDGIEGEIVILGDTVSPRLF